MLTHHFAFEYERLTQENYFLFCKKYEKESIILTVSFQLENVPFNIKSYRFECNDCNACSQTHDSSFCFWVLEKRLTQENCFLFCTKYEKESIILTVSFQLENVPFNVKSYRFECNDCNTCLQTIMTHHLLLGIREKVNTRELFSLL